MKAVPGIEGRRRLKPRFWDYDYTLMAAMGKAYRDLICSHLEEGAGACVVDLGCGGRPYEPLFQGRASRYIGVDIGDNPEADVSVRPGGPVPLSDGSADVVLSAQVLEHVVDVDTYLEECRRLLKPGGLLLLSTHGFWLYHPYPTDVRRWTCWGLRHEIEGHGFRVEDQRGCLGPLAYSSLLRLQLLRGALYQFGATARPLVGLLGALFQVRMMIEDRLTPAEVARENAAVYVIAARRESP